MVMIETEGGILMKRFWAFVAKCRAHHGYNQTSQSAPSNDQREAREDRK
jgi:hypothetical protein